MPFYLTHHTSIVTIWYLYYNEKLLKIFRATDYGTLYSDAFSSSTVSSLSMAHQIMNRKYIRVQNMSDFHINIVQLFLTSSSLSFRKTWNTKIFPSSRNIKVFHNYFFVVLYQGFHFLYTPQSNLCTYEYDDDDEKHISCLRQQQQHGLDLFSLSLLFVFNFIGDSLCVGVAITNNTELFHFPTQAIACYQQRYRTQKNTCWQHDSEHEF